MILCKRRDALKALTVVVVSDSLGETGAMVAKAAVAQFLGQEYDCIRYPYMNDVDQLKRKLDTVLVVKNPIIVYTLLDAELIECIRLFSETNGIVSVDLMSPILGGLSTVLDAEPSYQPGAIRKMDESYFSRVAAIEFAVKYDDGQDPRGLFQADVVLVGISRTSKTPLSMYLANRNIKVANIPLVMEVPPPKELFEIPAKKIIGLTNSPEKLNEIREERLKYLGLSTSSNYASMERIFDELDYSEQIMKKIGCPVINVANKAIEETSAFILSLLKKNGITFNS